MLAYVVNILTMFVGPDSWGDVTEAGLEEAIFVYLLRKKKNIYCLTVVYECILLFNFILGSNFICLCFEVW